MILTATLMGTEQILRLSSGAIKIGDTMNYRTSPPKPEPDGLLCEKIFGPIKNWECACGRLKGRRHRGTKCERCEVEVTSSLVRYKRRGHIELPWPVVNPITEPGVRYALDISQQEYKDLLTNQIGFWFDEHPKGKFVLLSGKRGMLRVDELLGNSKEVMTEVNSEVVTLAEMLSAIDWHASRNCNDQVNELINKDAHPDRYCVTEILVSPAAYREVLEIDGNYVNHDLNVHYGRIILHRNRMQHLDDHDAPRLIMLWEHMLLQKAVNELILKGSIVKKRNGQKREVKPVIASVQKKQGLPRGNLLGKRVDYSGRTVITTAPHLKLDEAGIPIKMAIELFRPFIIHKMLRNGWCDTYKEARNAWADRELCAYLALDEIIEEDDPRVILNRQPTLHRYGVFAFKIKLHPGHSIQMPALVCRPYNADHDGDQIAAHIPISVGAIEESRTLLSPVNNFLGSSDGEPLIRPSHEMLIGAYLMTKIDDESEIKFTCASMDEAIYLHESGRIKYADKIKLRNKITTIGRLLLEDILDCELHEPLDKRSIVTILSEYYDSHTNEECREMLDKFKDLTFEAATSSGFSFCLDNILTPNNREKLFEEIKTDLKENPGTREHSIRTWDNGFKQLQKEMIEESSDDNPLIVMLKTGARASMTQVSQLGVCVGFKQDVNGHVIPKPITSSFKDGLSPYEYFMTIYGGRKSMADKKFLTPVSGYLARKLMSSARDLYVSEFDCKTKNGIKIRKSRATGRFTPDGEIIGSGGSFDEFVTVRSPITCESKTYGGICQKCYGIDPSTRDLIALSKAVGAIAAQSLTEPTTQMSMRTFHTSGAVEIKSSPLTVDTSIYGKVILESVSVKRKVDDVMVSVKTPYVKISVINKEDSKTYIVNDDYCDIVVKSNDEIEAGAVLAVYERNLDNEDIGGKLSLLEHYYELRKKHILAVIAKEDGDVKLIVKEHLWKKNRKTYKKDKIHIYINGKLQGRVEDIPVYFSDGDAVAAGTFLTNGEAPIKDLFNRTSLELTGSVFVDRLVDLYVEEGVNVVSVHPEMIFRSMTELCLNERGKTDIRRRCRKPGRILIHSTTTVGYKYPSWVKNLGYGWVSDTLKKVSLGRLTSLDLPSERIMTGESLNSLSLQRRW